MLESSMRVAGSVSVYSSRAHRIRTRTETINLEGVHLAVAWVVHDPVSGDGCTDATGKVVHVICQVSLAPDVGHDL